MIRDDGVKLSRLLVGWERGEGSLPQRLADALKDLARQGDLAPGTSLPSERGLATLLGVSRSTVTEAYQILRNSDWLESKRGSRSRLRGSGVDGSETGGVTDGRLRTFTGHPDTGIDLSSGALECLPLVTHLIDKLRFDGLAQFVSTDGYFPLGLPLLRTRIALYYDSLGVPTSPEQVLVTSGAQQAVWLVAQGMIESGDSVVVEDPSYRGALEAFRARRARMVPIPTGPTGANLDLLAASTRRLRPALLYLAPTAHNPTGTTMPEANRRRLASLIVERGFLLVEDGCSADLLLGCQTCPTPLTAHVGDDNSIMIGTLSKLFWGGLRIGWLRAAPALVQRLGEVKKAVDLSCPVLDQVIATELFGHVKEARANRRDMLCQRLAHFEETLHQLAPHWSWLSPTGGTGLWVRIPGTDTVALSHLAHRHGVRIVPGPAYSAIDSFRDHVRLPFAVPVATAHQGLHTLASLV